MLAVVSPAKKLDFSPAPADLPVSRPALMADTEELMAVARTLTRADIARLMKISPDLAELNYQRFQAFELPFSPDNAKPAALAFAGDTYVGLDAPSLTRDELIHAQDHLRILSGLYGLLRPLDLIQPYRLEMGTRLANGRGADLYAFWGGRLTEALNAAMAESGGVLVNLASEEYFKAVQVKGLKGRLICPVFKEVKLGQARIVGLMAKRARGMMARFIIRNRPTDPEYLKSFRDGGYIFRPELSDETRWEFTRDAE